jgi:hypothetical protein
MTTKSFYLFLFIFSIALNPHFVAAQTDSNDPSEPSEEVDNSEKSYVSVGLSYDSKVVFQGRTDGIQQFGMTPNVVYQHKKGFNASYSANFWSAEATQPSLHNLGVGWDIEFSDSWSMSLNYARWFLGNGDAADASALNNYASVDVSFAPGTWSFSASPSINFGSSAALALNFSATKFFIFKKIFSDNDKFLIMPTFSTTIASDNRFSASKAALKRLKKGLTGQTFNPTVYEILIPVKYKLNDYLSFGATFHYVVPLNLTVAERGLKGTTYFSLNMGYKFFM